ncbi:hypothetical protein Lal_00003310 [Lupinus albus]|uniref:Putative High mobility group protein HMGA n=1 Tax=Lupinus albus TaxID=3870 RepID=A0A6A4NNL3_LUPAL|nr:putative High mobility group protein HMGA [Lupinus albus]KAF1883128.1 hypothetical protein Lal_00003310 [Lupinus albus]
MDPSSIPPPPPPTVVPFTDEPNPPTPPPTSSHPSYADMIFRAIESLKEKNGSTKRAISKYISEVYNPYLPPPSTHSTLLTQNLKRLKDNGFLQMVNNSYILPRSVPLLPSSQDSTQLSRPRGRPRKVQAQPQELVHVVHQNAEPVWAALGLSDEPQVLNMVPEVERKRLGRPRKTAVDVGQVVVSPTVASRGRGRPPGSKNKKKLGRPAKNESVAAAAVAGDGSGGIKRRPGRPRKNQQGVLIPLAPAVEGEVPVALAAGDVPVAVATSIRGRPKRNTGRGRGRGRGGGALPAQHRSSFRRPVGRPKKGTTSASISQNVAADGDLNRKLQYFQSKVKESLEVLKPYFTHESPLSAIAAIQDLEVLGAMDLNEPLEDDETLAHQSYQPQQQQPLQKQPPLQPPPQHHILQQPLALAPHQFFQQQFPQFQHLYQPQQYQNQHQQPPQQFQPPSSFHRLFNP